MEKPIISPDFTLEDIRKIREYDDFLLESMTDDEYIEYIKEKSRIALERMELFRQHKKTA
jgi:hypothetical protein